MGVLVEDLCISENQTEDLIVIVAGFEGQEPFESSELESACENGDCRRGEEEAEEEEFLLEEQVDETHEAHPSVQQYALQE